MTLRKVKNLIREDVIYIQHDRYGKVKCEVVELKSSPIAGMIKLCLKTSHLDFGPEVNLFPDDLVEIVLA